MDPGRVTVYEEIMEEDSNLTETEVTRRVMQEAMQEVLRCLRFTTKVGEGED